MAAKVIPVESIRQSVRSALFDGSEQGAGVSFFVGSYARDEGPGPHTHPYEETFVIQEGSVTFTVDGEEIEAGPGTIVVVPPRRRAQLQGVERRADAAAQHPSRAGDGHDLARRRLVGRVARVVRGRELREQTLQRLPLGRGQRREELALDTVDQTA